PPAGPSPGDARPSLGPMRTAPTCPSRSRRTAAARARPAPSPAASPAPRETAVARELRSSRSCEDTLHRCARTKARRCGDGLTGRRGRTDQPDAGGEPVQVGSAADGADLAVAEEAGQGHGPKPLGHGAGVVVGRTEEAGAAAVTRAEQGRQRALVAQ